MPGVAAPLLEREPHLEAAQDALAAALDGAGSTLLALGEGGVGKTELLAEVTRAARPSFTVLRARGDELEQDYPFGVVRQLLDPPLRRLEDREAAFVGAAEHAKAVFDLRSEAAMDASFAHLQGLLWVVVHLSEALGPLLLVVDDAHRADDISLRFLRFLSHRLDGLPVALLLATRPAEQIEDREPLAAMLDDPACRVLHVDRLSAAATADYLATTWDPAAAELASVAHALTNGNPLMLRELVAEAGRAGLQPHRTGPDDLRELGPRSITSRVRRSLASAPPAASILAQALAVLGDDVAATELVRFAQVDPAEAGPALDALLRLNVLEDGANGLRFAHPLVRASVAQLLSPVEREAAHARAARALHERGAPPHTIAAHVLATAPIGERWAADALTAAADRALSLSAPASAARFLARALDEPLPDPPATLAQLALAESHAGLPTALERFEAALQAADDPGEIPFQYAGALAMAGRTAQAFDALREVVGDPAGAPPVLRANLHAAALFTDAPDALALRDAIAASAGREPPSRAPGWPLVSAMEAFELAVRGAPAQDVAAILEPAVLGPGLQLDLASTSVYGYGIWAMILSERFDLARREVDRAIAEGRESGELVVLGLGLLLRCGVLGRQGSLLLAEADGMQTLMLSELPSWRFGAPAATQFLVDVLLDQGRSAEAAALLDKLPGRIEPGVGSNVDVLLWACRTRLLLAERRHAEALEAALATGRWVEAARLGAPALTYWREAAARAAAALGRTQEAEEHAAAAVAEARAVGAPAGLARALLLEAEVGPVAARDERLAEATECAERCSSPLVQARARLAAGRAERVAGRPANAREPLREAVELATEIGARPVVDAALEELAASGAKPRRAAYGRDLLTAAESRVARLAADGVTNREIAQALFVTQKTVETHLSSAYRKLSISSRAQLAAHLDP